MTNVLRRKRFIRLLYSKPVLLLLLILIIFMSKAAWNMYEKERETATNLAQVRVQHDELAGRESELRESVEALETPKGVEAEIRNKFGVIKEGEQVIYIVDSGAERDETTAEKSGLWQKIIEFFGF